MNDRIKTLKDMLEVLKNETTKGIVFINGADKENFLSYASLFEISLNYLGFLQTNGLKKGDEVILYEDNNELFLTCFWACILGGILPVPLAVSGKDEHKQKFFKVLRTLENPKVFTNRSNIERLEKFQNSLDSGFEIKDLSNIFLDSEKSLERHSEVGQIEKIEPQDIAFIQYSSGSTGNPKGVILNHANLIYNASDIAEKIGITTANKSLSWIPLTHDLGMIGFHITNMLQGCWQYIMPTSLFIRHPILWFQKASEHKITQLYSPNFGYQYAMDAIKDDSEYDWDLSSVYWICNGAEPISAGICREFEKRMAKFNLARNTITPAYGLAEATVCVSSVKPHEPLEEYYFERSSLNVGNKVVFIDNENVNDAPSFVVVGKPMSNCKVRICNDNDLLLENQTVGHIQISGKNAVKGYYNNDKATEKLYTKDHWLRTGDIGFITAEGALVITGRQKNMIIIQGQNYYNHDIENILIKSEDIALGKIAACGLTGGSNNKEQLVIFVLYKKNLKSFIELTDRINKCLSDKLGIVPDCVVPVSEMPKTTSGKVQHFLLVERYNAGAYQNELDEIKKIHSSQLFEKWVELDSNQRRIEVEKWLSELIASVTMKTQSEISFFEPLNDQGIKSIHIIQFVNLIKQKLNIDISVTILYKFPTLETFTEYFINRLFLKETELDTNIEPLHIEDELINRIEQLSDQEIEELLKN